MLNHYQKAVPEVPISNVRKTVEYYLNVLGCRFDWGNEVAGFVGISHGACQMVLTNDPLRHNDAVAGPVTILLYLDGREEVDELYRRWQRAGAKVISETRDRPSGLREFSVPDVDDNQLRVSYDCSITSLA